MMMLINPRINVIFVVLASTSFVYSQAVPNVDIADVSCLIDLIQDALGATVYDNVKEDDVGFYLTNANYTSKRMCLDGSDAQLLSDDGPIIIIIHGWYQTYCSPYNEMITAEYVTKGGYDIVNVNWGKNAKTLYNVAVKNAPRIGRIIADFIMNNNLAPDRVSMNGFSIGAHVAGFAGKHVRKTIKNKVKKIVGCDPAGPDYYDNCDKRLCTSDADMVVTIQTDKGIFGIATGIGHLNIQINGGTAVQPGCPCLTDILELVGVNPLNIFRKVACSHMKSYEYYAEIINDRKLKCTVCDTGIAYKFGMCSKNEKYIFRAEDIDEGMTGKCYAKLS